MLRPGGGYLAQHVGPATMFELDKTSWVAARGIAPRRPPRSPGPAAQAAGLQVIPMRIERLRVEFNDIGAVVYFLRKVIWTIPDFTVERYRERLHEMHGQIEASGPFVAHSTRLLVEARKP